MKDHGGQLQNDLFRSVPLQKRRSKIPSGKDDDGAHFPKLGRSASIDTLWMAGFLDHEQKTNDRKVLCI